MKVRSYEELQGEVKRLWPLRYDLNPHKMREEAIFRIMCTLIDQQSQAVMDLLRGCDTGKHLDPAPKEEKGLSGQQDIVVTLESGANAYVRQLAIQMIGQIRGVDCVEIVWNLESRVRSRIVERLLNFMGGQKDGRSS